MQCTAPVRSTVRVLASLMVMFAVTAGLASAAEQRVQEVNYSSVEVHGIKVFYREAGPADGPPIAVRAISSCTVLFAAGRIPWVTTKRSMQ